MSSAPLQAAFHPKRTYAGERRLAGPSGCARSGLQRRSGKRMKGQPRRLESRRGRPAPLIDGLSGDQRVILASEASQRLRKDDSRFEATDDAQASGRQGVVGPLRNVDAWYAAFGVAPSDGYRLSPAQRARSRCVRRDRVRR